MSGDMQANTGNFRDINILGTLIKNQNGYDISQSLVETWAPTGSVADGGGGTSRLTGTLANLGGSTWGWAEVTGKTTTDVVWSDATSKSVLLTSNQNTSYASMDPPKSFFKATWEMEGQSLGVGRTARGLYDAKYLTSQVGGSPIGKLDGVPKIGIEENVFTIQSTAIKLPLAQDDIFECSLEFASRDSGDWGGFYNNMTVAILKASDDSELYRETRSHGGSMAAWTIWSIPMVIKAGLVQKIEGAGGAGDAYTIIDEIKIKIATSVGQHSSGGGTIEGVVMTEMRIRKSPYFAFVSTNTVSADYLTPGVGTSTLNFTDGTFAVAEAITCNDLTVDDELFVKDYARIETSDDDTIVANMIVSARLKCEAIINRDIVAKTRSLFISNVNTSGEYGNLYKRRSKIVLPYAPISAITSVQTQASDGSLSNINYESFGLEDRYVEISSAIHKNIKIVYTTAGLGYDDLKNAIKMLASTYYDNRENFVKGKTVNEIPNDVQSILSPYIYYNEL